MNTNLEQKKNVCKFNESTENVKEREREREREKGRGQRRSQCPMGREGWRGR